MGRGGYGGVTWSNLQPTTFGCYSLLNSMSRCVFVIGLLYMFVALGMFKDIFASLIKLICCFANETDAEGCLDPGLLICIIFRIILGIGYFFIGFLLFKNAGDGNGKCSCGMVGCAPKVFLLVMAVLQIINFMIWLWVQIQCFLVNEGLGDFGVLLDCFSIFGVGLDMKGIYICVIVFCYGNESGSPMFGKGAGGSPSKGGGSGTGFGGDKSKTGTHASGTRGANSVQPMPVDEEAQAKDRDEDKPNETMMSETTEENRSSGGGGTPAGGSLKKKPAKEHKKRKSRVK